MLLETYTTMSGDELSKRLPTFLTVEKEVTSDPAYSMYNLSLKGDWKTSQKFEKSFTPTVSLLNGNDVIISTTNAGL